MTKEGKLHSHRRYEWDPADEISTKSFNDNLDINKESPVLDFSFSPQVSDEEDEWAGFEMELDRKKHQDEVRFVSLMY